MFHKTNYLLVSTLIVKNSQDSWIYYNNLFFLVILPTEVFISELFNLLFELSCKT